MIMENSSATTTDENPFHGLLTDQFSAHKSTHYNSSPWTENDALFFNQILKNNTLDSLNQSPSSEAQNGIPNLPLSSDHSTSSENAHTASSSSPGTETGSSEDFEGAHSICLNYINQILMDDDLEGKFDVGPENPALLAAGLPFYEILGEAVPSVNNNDYSNATWPYDPIEYRELQFDYTSGSALSNFGAATVQGIDSFLSDLQIESAPASQFQKGMDEALKFLPRNENLLAEFESSNGVYMPQDRKGGNSVEPNRGKGRRSPHDEDLDLLEGRPSKQSAVFFDDSVDIEVFDRVLLCSNYGLASGVFELKEKMKNESRKSSVKSKGQGRRKNSYAFVDLRSLLTACAQAVSTGNYKSASSLLRQLKQHSSPTGNANQRMGHYFAEGLEARLAGTGSQVYRSLVSNRIPMADYLKAYQLFLAACPFVNVSHWFALKTIIAEIKGSTRVHIIDFGINYGFQWPSFLQILSSSVEAPPKIRITGIDTPMPGFRPTELIDQTGLRLSDYARKFDIPFEFCAIASKLDAVRVEDLKIEEDEVLIVNCLYQLNKLGDETLSVDSPRNTVLKTIRKLNPNLFIHGNSNGSYNAPFFETRFREALFHYSSLFDMIEANVPREEEPRLLIEKVIFGREILNAVACEGPERVERPETYKQFIARNIDVGFSQVPLDSHIVSVIRGKMEKLYNKNFSIDEDRKCLLLGWKGRILRSLSVWKPDHLV